MIIALTLAIIYWNKIKNKPERWFLAYMSISILLDVVLGLTLKIKYEFSSNIVSNIVILLSNVILYYWFYEYLKDKKLLYISIVITIIAIILNGIHNESIHKLFTEANYVISFILIVHVFYYLKRLLSSNKVFDYNKIPAFWICIGLLLYQLNTVLVFFSVNEEDEIIEKTFFIILIIVSVIYYSLISYAIKLRADNE